MSTQVSQTGDEPTIDMTDRRVPQERGRGEKSHLVYWSASRCARCGYTVRNKGRGVADSRKECPEADEQLLSQRHDFCHGDRGGLTTWNDQPAPTAEEIIALDDKQWRQVVKHADY